MPFWNRLKKNSQLIAAHRGARSLRAENTMSAFKEAIGKCDFIELDVGFSRDGIAIIIHDDTLDRTSDVQDFQEFKKPYRVVDYDYNELLKLNFSAGFIKDDPFGTIKSGKVETRDIKPEKIPTLKEVLTFLRDREMAVNIEIKDMSKTKFDKIAVRRVLEIIQECDMEDFVLISSFNHNYIKEVYNLNPTIPIAALQEKSNPPNIVEYLKALHVKSYHPSKKIATKSLIKKLVKEGFFVNVYTVNDKDVEKRLFDEGVKAIFTDILN